MPVLPEAFQQHQRGQRSREAGASGHEEEAQDEGAEDDGEDVDRAEEGGSQAEVDQEGTEGYQ